MSLIALALSVVSAVCFYMAGRASGRRAEAQRWLMLTLLALNPQGLTALDISKRLHSRAGSLYPLLAKLEAEGLIAPDQRADGRTYYVSRTP